MFNDGSKLKAELIGKDPKTDLAVLRVKPDKPLKAVKFGNSDKLRLGEWVIAIGNPFSLGGSVTAGIVSARNRDINSGPYDNYIQTDAADQSRQFGRPAVQPRRRSRSASTPRSSRRPAARSASALRCRRTPRWR